MKKFSRRDFLRMLTLGAGTFTIDRLLVACGLPPRATASLSTQTPTLPTTTAALVGSVDTIYTDGVLLTMDPGNPAAQAIALREDRIIAVGTNEQVLGLRGADTSLISLEGRTMIPGFVDTHSHVINSASTKEEFLQLQMTAMSGGITTSTEMGVTPQLLERMLAYEFRGYIRLRYNTYMLYNDNCGEPFDAGWYKAHAPHQQITPHVRNQGVKIFADGGSCHVPAVSFEYPGGFGQGDLYMSQDQMNQVVAQVQADGYQVAVHALGDRAIEQVMNAIEAALAGQPNSYRHRIEHNAVVRPDMVGRYGQIGIVPTLFGGYATCLRTDPNSHFKYVVPDELGTEEWPYRSILDANPGLLAAWHADYPVFQHMDPIQNLYGFVTRNEVAADGSVCAAPDFLKHGAIRVEEALRIMTINSAYALFREDELGSLEPGKLADLVILSDNPLSVEPESIKDIRVLATLIGGRARYCADGSDALCPKG